MADIRLGNLLWKNNTQPISVSNPVNTKDVNSDSTKAELTAVKNELELVKAELQEIKANQLSGDQKVTLKDASGAVVSPATEAKLEQVRALLSGVATENKLEQARTLLDAISTKDFATSSKQDALNIAVEDLKSELILVKSELANIKANQLSGDQKVQLSGTFVTLYGGTTPAIEPGQELELIRQKIPNNVGRLKLAIAGSTDNVRAMEVRIRTARTDNNLDFISTCFWQTVEKPYESENWKQLGGVARSKIIDIFGEWVKVSIKNTSTTTPYYVTFYVGGAQ